MALFSLFRKQQYHILSPSQSDLDEGEKESGITSQGRVSQFSLGGIGFWSIIICLACTLANAILLRLDPPSVSYASNLASVTRADMAKLRRPNQFIGLDKVKRPFPPEPKTTTNYPIVLAIVDSEKPTGVFSDDPKRHITWKGMISPEERKVEVSKTVSTIVQFRAIDWGFESCSLTMKIPPKSMAYLPPEKFAINSSLVIGPDFNHFEVYRIEASEMPLDTKTLSYKTKPKALEKLATVSVDYGMDWKWNFPCERDSLHAFELRAASGLTKFEWWQDKEAENPVLYLEQHATA